MEDPGSLLEPGMDLDGRYRIGALIGTGGMSRVYVADDLELGRRVAIKVVHAIDGDANGDRVRTETIALASLTHPSLVVLHDARLAGPGPRYLVMEYVDGPSLSTRLAEGRMSSDEILGIAHDLAEALAVVHAGGIVHRDIKPSNILLAPAAVPGRAPRAKLADFGIAHLLGSERITRPGTMIGTAAYLAPEVALGGPPQSPSDIYSLGLVLLEAHTGRGAFPSAQGAAQVLARLAQDPEVPATLPPLWRELLSAMVQRDPARRPSAVAVVETLSSPRRTESDRATAVMPPVPLLPAESAATAAERYAGESSPRRSPRRIALVVGAAAAAIVLAGAIAIGASSLFGPQGAVAPAPVSSTSAPEPTATAVSTPAPSSTAPVSTQDPAPGPANPQQPKGPGGGKDNGKGKGND